MLRSGKLFDALPEALEDELVDILASSGGTRVERIVSTGQSSPEGYWYDQAEDELVILLRGAAGLELDDPEDLVEMEPGDWLLILAHRRHRVAWTAEDEPSVWLAVHFRSEL